jgi:hypothetical protein
VNRGFRRRLRQSKLQKLRLRQCREVLWRDESGRKRASRIARHGTDYRGHHAHVRGFLVVSLPIPALMRV